MLAATHPEEIDYNENADFYGVEFNSKLKKKKKLKFKGEYS